MGQWPQFGSVKPSTPSAPFVPRQQRIHALHSLCHSPSNPQPRLCLPALPVALSPVSSRGHPHPGDRQVLCGQHQGLQNVSCRVEASHSPLLVCFQQEEKAERGKAIRSLLSAQSQIGPACHGHREFRSFQQCQVVIGKQVRNEAFGRKGSWGILKRCWSA